MTMFVFLFSLLFIQKVLGDVENLCDRRIYRKLTILSDIDQVICYLKILGVIGWVVIVENLL